jgi:hexokinase
VFGGGGWVAVPCKFDIFCSACFSLGAYGPLQKYPGFADRVHEGLVDVFGEKGRCAISFYALPLDLNFFLRAGT